MIYLVKVSVEEEIESVLSSWCYTLGSIANKAARPVLARSLEA